MQSACSADLDNVEGLQGNDCWLKKWYREWQRTSLVNQPVFLYTRMHTRKVGGGNARKNSLGTPARFLGH